MKYIKNEITGATTKNPNKFDGKFNLIIMN